MNNIKKASMVFGVIFVLIALMGFVPAFTPDGKLIGLFQIDALHNLIHLLSGIAALIASRDTDWARLYFRVFGAVYGLVTIIGFATGSAMGMPGMVEVNMADNMLHIAITASALYFGFFLPTGNKSKASHSI